MKNRFRFNVGVVNYFEIFLYIISSPFKRITFSISKRIREKVQVENYIQSKGKEGGYEI